MRGFLQQGKLGRFAKSMREAPTQAEAVLWRLLRNRRFSGVKFCRQVPIGDYIADFACFEARLIVEADGSQHAENARDKSRDAWFEANRFRVRHFWNADILERREEIAETLWHDLNDPSPGAPAPPSPARGEGSRARGR